MEQPKLDPSNESLGGGVNKVVGEDVPTQQPATLKSKVGRIDRGILVYVAKQMGRVEITGEVIGQALLFQDEMEGEQ